MSPLPHITPRAMMCTAVSLPTFFILAYLILLSKFGLDSDFVCVLILHTITRCSNSWQNPFIWNKVVTMRPIVNARHSGGSAAESCAARRASSPLKVSGSHSNRSPPGLLFPGAPPVP